MTGLASRLFALVAISILATAGQSLAQSAPAAPSNLTAVAASSTSIRLNWIDNQTNPKEDGFTIQRSLNGSTGWLQVGNVGTDVRTFTNVGLTSGVRYYYRVQARRGTAVSAWSNIASAVPTVTTTTSTTTSSTTSTTVPTSTLAAPSNLTAVAFSTSSIRLAWKDNQVSPKEDGFNIERSPNGSSSWAKIGSVGTDVTTFTNLGLTNGVTYWYRVRAKRGTYVSAASNVAAAAPVSATTTSTTTSSTSTTRLTTTSTAVTSTTSTTRLTTTSTVVTSTTSTTTTIASGGGPALVGFVPGVGTAMGIQVTSGLAVVGSAEYGLSAVNVANPALPVPIGGADKPFYGLHVARQGTRAVVAGLTATGVVRLWVLDVTDTTRPRVLGGVTTTVVAGSGGSSTGCKRVALTPSGNLALLAMGNAGLWVIDVSVPTAPVLRGTLTLGDTAWGVTVNSTGTYAYVAAGSAGLKIVSLANPAAPTIVGSFAASGRYYRDVAVVGTTAYAVNQSGTLDILNVSTATAPAVVGVGTLSAVGLRVAAEGTLVAVTTETSTASQLVVFDATTPTAPVRRSTVVVGSVGEAQGVGVSGGFAYVAAAASGVRIYDARMTNPPLAAALEETFLPRGVAVVGTRAVVLGTYLPTNQLRFKVLHVPTPLNCTSASDPDCTPVIDGELATAVAPVGTPSVALTPSGALALAAMGDGGLWVVDVSVPTAPVLRGKLTTLGDRAWGVAVNGTGTYAYVAAGSAGLKIVSLANPAAPTIVGSFAASGRYYRDVAVVGTTAYAANQSGTLDILNVVTPTAPTVVGVGALSAVGLRVAAEGTVVAVTTENSTASQLDVFDTTIPTAPVRRSTVVVGPVGSGLGVARNSGQAFVATGAGGLRIYDLANPASPTLRASGLTVGDANAVAAQNGYAYVADYPATLSVVDW